MGNSQSDLDRTERRLNNKITDSKNTISYLEAEMKNMKRMFESNTNRTAQMERDHNTKMQEMVNAMAAEKENLRREYEKEKEIARKESEAAVEAERVKLENERRESAQREDQLRKEQDEETERLRKEKEAAVEAERVKLENERRESAQRDETLRKKNEEEMAKRFEEKLEHQEEVGKLHRELHETVEAAAEEKISLEREKNRVETALSNIMTAHAFTSTLFVQKASDEIVRKKEEMKEVLLRLYEQKKELHKKNAEEKGYVDTLLSTVFGDPNSSETVYDSMDKETSNITRLAKEMSSLSANLVFKSQQRQEAKRILTIIKEKNADLDSELAKCRQTKTLPVCLDGIMDCFKVLDRAIDDFPSMATQTLESICAGQGETPFNFHSLPALNGMHNANAAIEDVTDVIVEEP